MLDSPKTVCRMSFANQTVLPMSNGFVKCRVGAAGAAGPYRLKPSAIPGKFVIGFEPWVGASGTVRLTRGIHEITLPQQNLHYSILQLQYHSHCDLTVINMTGGFNFL